MSEKYGHGFISGIGSGTGMTEVTGDHHSTMIAYEDGRDATFHLYVYRGNTFEIIETVEISGDGQKIIRRERFTAPDGTEQTLVAELPIAKPK